MFIPLFQFSSALLLIAIVGALSFPFHKAYSFGSSDRASIQNDSVPYLRMHSEEVSVLWVNEKVTLEAIGFRRRLNIYRVSVNGIPDGDATVGTAQLDEVTDGLTWVIYTAPREPVDNVTITVEMDNPRGGSHLTLTRTWHVAYPSYQYSYGYATGIVGSKPPNDMLPKKIFHVDQIDMKFHLVRHGMGNPQVVVDDGPVLKPDQYDHGPAHPELFTQEVLWGKVMRFYVFMGEYNVNTQKIELHITLRNTGRPGYKLREVHTNTLAIEVSPDNPLSSQMDLKIPSRKMVKDYPAMPKTKMPTCKRWRLEGFAS